MRRGFSLLEAMVCVVIVGIAAAIALPSVLPLRGQANLQGSCDGLAALLARARLEAMVQKRCARARVVDVAKPGANGGAVVSTVVVEVLASFDCDQTPLRGPFLPPATGAASPWVEVTRVRANSDERFVVDRVPVTGPGGDAGELRFRPTGRVFGQNNVVTDDSALFTVRSPAGALSVLVQGNGLVCRLGGKAAVNGPAGPECP